MCRMEGSAAAAPVAAKRTRKKMDNIGMVKSVLHHIVPRTKLLMVIDMFDRLKQQHNQLCDALQGFVRQLYIMVRRCF